MIEYHLQKVKAERERLKLKVANLENEANKRDSSRDCTSEDTLSTTFSVGNRHFTLRNADIEMPNGPIQSFGK